jgi:hypothetical protein
MIFFIYIRKKNTFSFKNNITFFQVHNASPVVDTIYIVFKGREKDGLTFVTLDFTSVTKTKNKFIRPKYNWENFAA